jgi:hypothetical protein
LSVIDLDNLTVVVNKKIDGVYTAPLKRPFAQHLAIRSKDSTIFFEGSEKPGDSVRYSEFLQLNWTSGEIHSILPVAGLRHGGYPPVGLPAGFGVAGFKTIEIYNGPTPHEIAIPKTPLSFDSQVFFVPTIGLMEYYNGVHHQLTDEALSAVPAVSQRRSND